MDMSDEIDEHLKNNNSNDATFNGNTIIFSSDVDRATVFEELIHLGQHKNTDFELGINDLDIEIEAAEKLLKNAKAYKLSEAEIEQTKINLIHYKKRKK